MRALRLLAFIVIIEIVQVSVTPHLRLAGVVPDLGLIVAVAIACREGPETGALVGFVAGFAYDLFLETPLGLSALAYALVGYAIGAVQAGLLRSPRWLPPFLGAIGGLAGGLLFIGIGFLAGVDAVRGARAVETVSLAAVYDALLAPFVFWLTGRLVPAPRPAGLGFPVR